MIGNTSKEEYRRNLPHIQPQDAMFFITFRLYDSIPLAKLDDLKTTYLNTNTTDISGLPIKQLKQNQQEEYFMALDDFLNTNQKGPYYLAKPEIANLVYDSITYRDGKEYELVCFCIMSNHVHMVIYKLAKPLDTILKELKSFTGKEALKILRDSGQSRLVQSSQQALQVPLDSEASASLKSSEQVLRVPKKFWQPESFDRIIRDRNDMAEKIYYTLNNPVKAGLVSVWNKWQWSFCRLEFME